MSTGQIGLGQPQTASPSARVDMAAPAPPQPTAPLHSRVLELENRAAELERQNMNQANCCLQLVQQIQQIREQLGLSPVDESTYLVHG